ncbi:MAG: hypothetical protein M1825_004130 [Sarcosagium campestre]|nr:MAG: hypothetical protein M1825_004130 [Sarcosagium campestre]
MASMGGLGWWTGAGQTGIAVAAVILDPVLLFVWWISGCPWLVRAEWWPSVLERKARQSYWSEGRGWGEDGRAPLEEAGIELEEGLESRAEGDLPNSIPAS